MYNVCHDIPYGCFASGMILFKTYLVTLLFLTNGKDPYNLRMHTVHVI